ncbi:MAG TPA: hypothetical protein VF529_09275 [Solirubrobacteraceae bacterium]
MRRVPMWAVLVVASLALGVVLLAARDSGSPDAPTSSAPRACAAPIVTATARRTLRARESAEAVQPVRVRVTERAFGPAGGVAATVTARSEVSATATATGTAPVGVTARLARRACASAATVEEAEARATREAREAGLRAARREAQRRLRATLPPAERRLRERLRARALRSAARRARAAAPAEQERLREQASAEALRRAQARAARD